MPRRHPAFSAAFPLVWTWFPQAMSTYWMAKCPNSSGWAR